MSGEMIWRSLSGDDSATKILMVRMSSSEPWKPYYQFKLAAPDYRVPFQNLGNSQGSKGYATFQVLLKMGFKLVPSNPEAIAHTVAQLEKAYGLSANRVDAG